MHPRTIAAIVAGKLAGFASRASRRGGGTAIAGIIAERIDPRLIPMLLAQARRPSIAVTGTNGKTTTSLMLNRIAREAKLLPLHNRSGSNLMRGVAAMLVESATLEGRLPNAARRLPILEVDEATVPELVRVAPPRVVVFTNLFRDQLDRYGEVDTVAKAWERAIASMPPDTTLILNADDPAVAHLGKSAGGRRTLYYGIEDPSAGGETVDHASDFRTCLNCGAELCYALSFYGHLGHWRCASCGNTRAGVDVSAERVTLGDDSTAIRVRTPDGTMNVSLPLTGLYNTYNALAAIGASIAAGLPPDATARALETFSAAFGRQERFAIDGRDVQVLLGKNPTGLNEVLRAIARRDGAKRILFFLNDGVADGQDVSWIWDADYEIVQPQTEWVLAAGTRAEDLALRLKYAGFGDDVRIEHDTEAALDRALAATPEGSTLYVVPTYTAMLDVRERLARRSKSSHFWESR